MAVHRRGLDLTKPPLPKRYLGKVLVTIDDLDALVKLLAQRDNNTDELVIEFVGGKIDSAADMRELSDEELRFLVVKTKDAEVRLSDNEATCIAPAEVCNLVYQRWARTRQTNRVPRRTLTSRRFYTFTTVALVFMVAGALIMILTRYAWLGVAFVSTVGFAFMAVISVNQVRYDYAYIVPSTLDEYRKDQVAGRRQLITWLIAVSAIAVASLTALVVSLIKQ